MSSKCQQNVLYFIPTYTHGTFTPLMSLQFGNCRMELWDFWKLARFQGWSTYLVWLWSLTGYFCIPNPFPNLFAFRSAAYSTLSSDPVWCSTMFQYLFSRSEKTSLSLSHLRFASSASLSLAISWNSENVCPFKFWSNGTPCDNF